MDVMTDNICSNKNLLLLFGILTIEKTMESEQVRLYVPIYINILSFIHFWNPLVYFAYQVIDVFNSLTVNRSARTKSEKK